MWKLPNPLDWGQTGNRLGEKNSSDIDHEGYETRLKTQTTFLVNDLGMPSNLVNSLRSALIKAYSKDSADLRSGANGVLWRFAGAIAAPIVGAVLIATAPASLPAGGFVAAGSGGVELVSVGASTAGASTAAASSATAATVTSNALLAGSPAAFNMVLGNLAFGAASILTSAAISASGSNTGIFCNLSEAFGKSAPGYLIAAPFSALVPYAPGLVGKSVMALGGSVEVAGGVMATVNLGAAVGVTGLGLVSGLSKRSECVKLINDANTVSDGDGGIAAANAKITAAYEQCVQAGIDLGFALFTASELTKFGLQSLGQAKASTGGTISATAEVAAQTAASFDGTDALLAKDGWAKVGDLDDATASGIFKIVDASYAKIGGSPFKSAADIKNGYLDTFQIVRDEQGAVTAFQGSWTSPFGRKGIVTATDGSASGKALVKAYYAKLGAGEVPGTFSELSQAPAYLATQGSKVKVVTFENVQTIMQGQVLSRPTAEELAAAVASRELPDSPDVLANAYWREIRGIGRHLKVMFGDPILPAH